jgi:hypothetical protein
VKLVHLESLRGEERGNVEVRTLAADVWSNVAFTRPNPAAAGSAPSHMPVSQDRSPHRESAANSLRKRPCQSAKSWPQNQSRREEHLKM